MIYAQVQDMIDRFGDLEIIQISDRDADGLIDEDVVQTALADASAEIDAYLGRYPKTFQQPPLILTRLCCDIARYRLSATSGVTITEEIKNRYKIDVLDLLRAMARGDVQLGIDEKGEEYPSDESGVVFTQQTHMKVFTRD